MQPMLIQTRWMLASLVIVSATAGFALAEDGPATDIESKQSALPEGVEIVPESSGEVRESPTHDSVKTAELVVSLTNKFRQEEGLSPVEADAKLTQTARDFARFMARTHRYGHHADDRTPGKRAEAAGYAYCIVLENIAYHYSSEGFNREKLAAKCVKGWQESPPHREAMVDADVLQTGVAIVQSLDTGYYFAVQMFGRPKSASIDFELTNRSDVALPYHVDDEKFELEPRQIRTHERCRPPKLVIDWPQLSKGLPPLLKPAGGERYEIGRNSDGNLSLRESSVK